TRPVKYIFLLHPVKRKSSARLPWTAPSTRLRSLPTACFISQPTSACMRSRIRQNQENELLLLLSRPLLFLRRPVIRPEGGGERPQLCSQKSTRLQLLAGQP